MKKLLFILSLSVVALSDASAQLQDGATAPDFTFTDINNNSHNLYSYLNQGKYVALDVFTTWCHPCWDYHTLKCLDSMYEKYDDPGAQTWKVLTIELDDQTGSAELHGSGQWTMGDWVTGTPYPIIDPAAGTAFNQFKTDFSISYYPTLYLIGPNKKIYTEALYDYADDVWVSSWEKTAKKYFGFTPLPPAGIDDFSDANPLTIFPNPAKGATTLYFKLNSSTNAKLEVVNMMGQVVERKDLGRLSSGDQSIKYDLNNLISGMYYFSISVENSRTITKKLIIQ
jgi:thiol-disulfide isomerase/thioredoxin